MLQRYAGATNLSIEQPLPYDDIVGASFLRQNLSIPLILDESVWSPEAMMRRAARTATATTLSTDVPTASSVRVVTS